MSDDLNKGFDFTNSFAKEGYLFNTVQYKKLLKLIELFETISDREIGGNGSVEISPVDMTSDDTQVRFDVILNDIVLTSNDIEVLKKNLEPHGTLGVAASGYGTFVFSFFIPDVYVPKAQ